MAVAEGSPADAGRAKAIDHPSGVRRLTALRLVEPPRDDPDNPTEILTRLGLAKVERGDAWLLELTLDRAPKAKSAICGRICLSYCGIETSCDLQVW